MRCSTVLGLLVLLGCGGPTGSSPPPAGDPLPADSNGADDWSGDPGTLGDPGAPGDARTGDGGGDASGDSIAVGDPGGDAAGGDSVDPYSGRPVGQCVSSADCPINVSGGRSCNRSAPGGICQECGTEQHCPFGTVCNIGSCVMECSDDEDCAPGMWCGTPGCLIISCVGGVCPVPLFGCNASDRCVRVSCPAAEPCPTGTTCTDGLCIENRAL